MKKLLLIVALIACSQAVNAQTIKGIVQDSESNPISYATVLLCSAVDTTQIAYTLTDLEGKFSLNTSEDYTLLHVSFVGYKPLYLTAETDNTITLEQEALQIKEAEVKGSRPISTVTSQGVQTTVENTVLSEMGTGNDVLKRIPMVNGDEGEFEVLGRGAAKIYINNREVRDASEIDNLNSSNIASVEVIANPGARYDATVAAVIIIKTIKKQGDGFSFNVRSTFTTWENNDYVNQINTNYRKGGLDVFANLNYSDYTGYNFSSITQNVYVDTLWNQLINSNYNYVSSTIRGVVGASYEINDNHNIGLRYEIKDKPKNTQTSYFASETYADGILYDILGNDITSESYQDPESSLNMYYTGKIKKLTIDFNTDYTYKNSTSPMTNYEDSELSGSSVINSYNNTVNSLWAAKLIFSYPVWKGNFSVGSEYINIDRSDTYTNDVYPNYDSDLDISESNLALFAEYQISSKIGNFNLGMRYENASYEYFTDKVLNDDLSKSYNQWFPSASYATQLGKISLMLNYNSKVVRPSYSQLSNNYNYLNSLSLQTGNPYLNPTIKQSLSLVGIWKNIQANVSYTHQKNAIVYWSERYEEDPKISIITFNNVDKMPGVVASVTYAPKVGIWKPQISAAFIKQWLDLNPYGVDVQLNKPIMYYSLKNTFELPNDFIINADCWFQSKGNADAVYLSSNQFSTNFGISKNFFEKALNVKIAVSNIVKPNNNVDMYMPQYDMSQVNTSDNRNISLTVRYKFNSANSKYKGQSAGADAMKRL